MCDYVFRSILSTCRLHVTHIHYIYCPYNLHPVKIDFTIFELLTGSSRLTQFDALVPVRFDLYVFIRWNAVKSKDNTMSDQVSSPTLYPRTEEVSNYIHVWEDEPHSLGLVIDTILQSFYGNQSRSVGRNGLSDVNLLIYCTTTTLMPWTSLHHQLIYIWTKKRAR